MNCPFCGFEQTSVIDSRNQDDFTIRRRRSCDKCNKRFTTFERIESIQIFVKKKDGTRELYDRNKIKSGIMYSCAKRPISAEDIDNLLNEIELDIFSTDSKELTSNYIGEIVLKKLKEFDKVAYIRFASVYREFKEVNDFGHVAKNINKN